jgi:purine-nucleoside phosphorylase
MLPIARPKRRSRERAIWGTLAVEMEAAALYAFGTTSGNSIVCFAHVTNSMAQTEGDFEKGEADGAKATLAVVAAAGRGWRSYRS